MKRVTALLVTISLACLLVRHATAEENEFSLRLDTAFLHGSIDGFLQTSAGGAPGTTSVKRPTFEELAFDTVSVYDVLVGADLCSQRFFGGAQLLNLSRSAKLCTTLTSQNQTFPSGERVQADVQTADENDDRGIWNTVRGDYKEFYSPARLMRLGIAFGGGALLANTSIDQDIQDWYQDDVRSSGTDDFAKVAKTFGDGKYLIPLSLLSAAVGYSSNSGKEASAIGRWGRCTARAYLVGGPAMLIMQRVTGASRPGETEEGSNWNPFEDSNGVSGHAFIGAVPFLTIARMNEENRAMKYLMYVASTLAAWSRTNDNDHFTSQAALGWYIAWEATDAVWDRDKKESKLTVRPLLRHDSYGVCVSLKW